MLNLPKEEEKVLEFWDENKIYERLKERNKDGKVFYYLDGPPYTTGAIHIGHAWGKALRDSIMRYKRMNGFKVWDQPGFDMHGLPIEVSVEKNLGIENKKEILEKLGMAKFIDECQKYALEQLWPMVKDFKRLGVWMNWEDPYMTIKNEYIEGAWFALKKANENGHLYRGKKSMTWCARCATALAKHELEYETVEEPSIFVKLPIAGKDKEYLVVWTTTPWTIPFNMAVMAHPEFDYVKAKIKSTGETWILAKGLAGVVIRTVANDDFEVVEEFKGEKLKGLKYEQPFKEELDFHRRELEDADNSYTVLMSDQYVDLSAGSGLVHCAPGCGPEDYEVGKVNGIPAYNELDEHGKFPKSMGSLEGLQAKKDDKIFIDLLKSKDLLIETTQVEHEYAHCWRCKNPVVFRATDQWFLGTEKLKDKMIEENNKVVWVPEWAGNKWFDSWLKNLQDWCISRQRFWGIPLPIWECSSCERRKVIGSKKEIETLANVKLDNLHRPHIDEVTFECECGGLYKRTEDILDVWLDSGASPWAPLGFPMKTDLYEELQTPDLILEGKDQIRGWFNSLMALSMVSFGKAPYKAVYMHGFINDAQGRKMSKSLKNIISPYEVIEQFGADTLRFYSLGAANPGVDLNYNMDDVRLKQKNLLILFNVHKLLLDNMKAAGFTLEDLDNNNKGVEEKYIYSKLNSAIKKTTDLFDNYKLNEVPLVIEDLFLELSRTYIQLVREKLAVGSDDEKKVCLKTIFDVTLGILVMSAPVVPFVSEIIYQKLKEELGLVEESVHMFGWPKVDESLIDETMEKQMLLIGDVMQGILAAREKAKRGVRWPIQKVSLVTLDLELKSAAEALQDLILRQTNVKELSFTQEYKGKVILTANKSQLGKTFKQDSPKVIPLVTDDVMKKVFDEGEAEVEGHKIVKDHIIIKEESPDNIVSAPMTGGSVYLDTSVTEELENEGYAREVMRRVQQLRKEEGLHKADSILLSIMSDIDISKWKDEIALKCGAEDVAFEDKDYLVEKKEKIKNEEFVIKMHRN